MDWMVAFFVPTVIFLTFVAPIWIFMHYRSKQRAQGSLSEAEREEMEVLKRKADRMIERVQTLEAILDAQTPDWRKRVGVE
jgi:phage shock protein B